MRLLLALAALLLAACAPEPPGIPVGNADSEACQANSAPFLGNLRIDSACTVGPDLSDCRSDAGKEAIALGEEPSWALLVDIDYADPGIAGATDPPNMVGGLVTTELSLGYFGSFWLYDVDDYTPAEGSTSYLPVVRDATQGTILFPALVPEIEVDYYSPATFNVRVRDACDRESNNVSCRYLMGTGLWTDCEPPEAPADP